MIADQMSRFTSGTRYQHCSLVVALLGDGVGGPVLAGFACECELVDWFVGVAMRRRA